MAFGRPRKKKQDDADASPMQDAPADAAEAPDAGDTTATAGAGDATGSTEGRPGADVPRVPAGHVSSADYARGTLGPFDAAEQDTASGYIDLGALRINAAEGLQLRLEVEERSKRVIAVTLDLGGSTLQLQAFAAPKTEGLWDEIREQIGASVGAQGGTVEERPGRLGTELLAKLPAQTPDGQAGYRVARFVGVNGPRWFLRGVFGGPAALDQNAAAPIEALFRSVVVVRGEHPLPPRELLPLKLPKDAAAGPPAAPAPARPDLNPLERGPEITETR
ncbi:DUF3710 domain-containing protein [Arthrobacter ruber]|uniref:DUF3710 domain-containing protein n=1 Tax=Arthrobacter ruber TaxID=1258893 RepID=UPI000CF39D4F|nr:DUF3710 domain-containing protein [Arthrobacter ruber]